MDNDKFPRCFRETEASGYELNFIRQMGDIFLDLKVTVCALNEDRETGQKMPLFAAYHSAPSLRGSLLLNLRFFMCQRALVIQNFMITKSIAVIISGPEVRDLGSVYIGRGTGKLVGTAQGHLSATFLFSGRLFQHNCPKG